MGDNDYDSNLQLTSIISKLAQLPHPYLHEYLLNPTIPLVPGVRSLYTVLKEVLGKAVVKSESISHFPLKMLGCKKDYWVTKTLHQHRKNSLVILRSKCSWNLF